MIYVFEGQRNSGKTFISTKLSDHFHLDRFQFDFVKYFNGLELDRTSRETHAFSLGKEFMIMQLFRDLSDLDNYHFIHDRGILTVLAWALLEKRIVIEELEKQVKLIKDLDIMQNVTIFYINGDNPNKEPRNKDEWDEWDNTGKEKAAYETVISLFEKYDIKNKLNKLIVNLTNNFDEESITNCIDVLRKENEENLIYSARKLLSHAPPLTMGF